LTFAYPQSRKSIREEPRRRTGFDRPPHPPASPGEVDLKLPFAPRCVSGEARYHSRAGPSTG